MKELGVMPNLIISLFAKRARKTAKLFAEINNAEVKIELDKNLYLKTFATI